MTPADNRPEDTAYYARTPMLVIDAAGTVTDMNAACRHLFGADVSGCVHRHYLHLLQSLRPVIDGDVLPFTGIARTYLGEPTRVADPSRGIVLTAADLDLAASQCVYHSARFGEIRLQVFELPRVDGASGNCGGSLVSFELRDDRGEIRRAIDDRLRQEVMWDVYAASYDAVLAQLPFYLEVVDRHVSAMQPPGIREILDVGVGTGTATVRLLDMGKTMTGVDPSRAMLRRLRSKLDERRARRLTIVEDTAERLSHLSDETFDGVSVLLAFFAMGDPVAAFREARRLLKPGGTLIVTEPRACFDGEALMAEAERALANKGVLQRLSTDWARIRSVAPLISRTIQDTRHGAGGRTRTPGWDAETIFELLGRDGFEGTTFRESHHGYCATITGIKASRRRGPRGTANPIHARCAPGPEITAPG